MAVGGLAVALQERDVLLDRREVKVEKLEKPLQALRVTAITRLRTMDNKLDEVSCLLNDGDPTGLCKKTDSSLYAMLCQIIPVYRPLWKLCGIRPDGHGYQR